MGYRNILCALTLLLTPFFCRSEAITDDLDAFFPRPEASENETELYRFIEASLDENEIPYRYFNFDETDIGHSFSRCMEVTVGGERADTLILSVPVNHPLGATTERSGSINIAIALEILKQAASKRLPLTLKVLFLCAEFGDEPAYPMGSRLFLENFFPDYPVTVLYLNLRNIPSRLVIRSGARGIVSPNWLIDNYSANLRRSELPFLTVGNENQLFRLGLTAERTIIEPYLKVGYPAVSFEGRYDDVSSEYRKQWIPSFAEFFWRLTESYRDGIPQEWDRHYLFFQVLSFYLIVPETTYVVLLGMVLVVTLLYIQLFPHRFFGNLATVLLNLWFPLLLLLLWLLSLLGATYAIQGILWVRNSPELWKAGPLLFLAFKVVLTILFFVALSPFVMKFPHPRQTRYYSSSALLVLLLNVAILSLIDISFTYYFLWAYFFIFLFSAFHNRLLKLIFLAISPFWLIKATVDMFSFPKYEFCRGVLLSDYYGNLLISTIFLPYLLILVSLGYLFSISPAARLIIRRMNLGILGAASVGLLIFLLIFSPFSSNNPQNVTVTNTIDPDEGISRIEVSSNSPLGKLFYWKGDNPRQIDTLNRQYLFTEEGAVDLLSVESSDTEILDRKNIQLVFNPTGQPYKLQLSLTSEKEFILFDSNFPFVREIETDTEAVTYRILIGKNPPKPLTLLLTLPSGRRYDLSVRIEYLQPPFRIEVSGKNKDVQVIVKLEKSLDLRT